MHGLILSYQYFELKIVDKFCVVDAYLLSAISDFNAKPRHCYNQDNDTFEEISVGNIISQFGLYLKKKLCTSLKIHPPALTYIPT